MQEAGGKALSCMIFKFKHFDLLRLRSVTVCILFNCIRKIKISLFF